MVGKGSYIALGSRRAFDGTEEFGWEHPSVCCSHCLRDMGLVRAVLIGTTLAGRSRKSYRGFFEDWSASVKGLITERGLYEMRVWPLYETPKPSEGGQWLIDMG